MAMKNRTTSCALAVLALGLVLPAVAPAKITEVGVLPETTPATVPSCPGNPCLAVSRTTGFQVRVGTAYRPLTSKRAGTIVAWTISLGKPNATQIKFFNANEGGESEASLAVVREVPGTPHLNYKLIAESPAVKLKQYFGETAQFPLERTIPIKKGDIVALSVPTWAPALALGFPHETSWRASRAHSQCSSTSAQSTQTLIGSAVQYICLYQTARLTYSATLISTP
ncbi:MAG TPA: hypothetical protein VH115_00075 [Solirubrobacteraceae bacterium]|nr:hypothetical protein [Solirubrobacteraceae bacterium]